MMLITSYKPVQVNWTPDVISSSWLQWMAAASKLKGQDLDSTAPAPVKITRKGWSNKEQK